MVSSVTAATVRDVNVVGYIRVSSATQVDDGLGLDIQIEALEQWATAHGHQLLAIHRDEGITGTKDSADRPGLAGALLALEDGAEALVVMKLDRLARHLTVQEATLAQAWKHGARVFAVDVGEILRDDPDDPMRTAMRQMIGVFAQLERSMIAARMRAGRRMKHAKGGYAYGAPRFGQRAEDKSLVPATAEQKTIARIVELRSGGATLASICSTLEAEGRPAKRGTRWHPKVVARVLQRVAA